MRALMLSLTERDVRARAADARPHQRDGGRRWRGSPRARWRQPVRTVLEVGPDRAYFGVMPAALDDPPAVGAKLVTVYARNHERGLTSHLATIVLLDHETGALAAVIDGRYITEARTAAVSAVSVRQLARPDARVLAIIGSGVQARSHLEAIRHVRDLADVRVWSPNRRIARRSRGDVGRDRPAGARRRLAAAPRARRRHRRAGHGVSRRRSSMTRTSRPARTSWRSARAGRTSARCRRRSSRARACSSIRARPRCRKPATC